ncbi:MAG: CBS domain-containing protein [Candidatus Limnocylindria bacterium]
MDLSPEQITQGTSIGEVDRLLRGTDPILVRATDSLQRLAELAIETPGCRVVSVVDDKGRLIGLVPVRLLVNDIFLKIVPEEFLGAIGDVEGALEYAQHIRARVAADIMVSPTSVPLTATVRDAFETMHKARLNGLPILDEDRRVVSYLDQLELLLVWVRATGRSVLLRPAETAAPETDAPEGAP